MREIAGKNTISEPLLKYIGSKDQYHVIFNSSPDAIIVANLEGIIVAWNPAATKMFGYNRQEAIGKNADIIFGKSRLKERDRILKKIQKNKIESPYEAIRIKKDGSVIKVLVTVTRIKNEKGAVIGLMASYKNLSLKEKNKAAQDILSNIGLVLALSKNIQSTLETIAQIFIPQLANWVTIYMPEDSILKPKVIKHTDPKKIKWAYKLLEKFPANPDDPNGEYSVFNDKKSVLVPHFDYEAMISHFKNDDERLKILKEVNIVSYMIVPLVSHNKVYGTLSLISTNPGLLYNKRDLHVAEELGRRAAVAIENSELNQKLKDTNNRLEKIVEERTQSLKIANKYLNISNKELQDFLFVASHDLQEPLRKIQTFSTMLAKSQNIKVNEKEAGFLTVINQSSNKMRAQLNDLMKFSKLFSKNFKFEMVDVNSLLTEVSKVVLPKENISSTEILISKLPEIEGVAVQLKQLFIELFENSIKFKNPKRKLMIKIYPVYKTAKNLDNYLEICFEDNGMGFSQEYEEKIFKIFEKLSDSKKIGSTGIGLPIIKKIAEVHGGSVSAKGTPGKGSKFYITLPLKQS